MSGKAEKGASEGTAYLLSVAVGKRVLQAGKFSEWRVEGESVFVEVTGGEGVGGVGGWILQLGDRSWEAWIGD